jgi:DNA-directed RNA polymerase subunit M/transcription elongation factor TFIIS
MPRAKLTQQNRADQVKTIASKLRNYDGFQGRSNIAILQDLDAMAQQIESRAFERMRSVKEIALYYNSIVDQMFECRCAQSEHWKTVHFAPVEPFVNPLQTPDKNNNNNNKNNKVVVVQSQQMSIDTVPVVSNNAAAAISTTTTTTTSTTNTTNTTATTQESSRSKKLSNDSIAKIITVDKRNIQQLVKCANCGPRGKVTWYAKQTRSGDESQTLYCQCDKCNDKWKVSR